MNRKMNGKEAEKFYKETIDFEGYKNGLMPDEVYESRTFRSEFNHFLKMQKITMKCLEYRIGIDAKQLSRYSTGERTPERRVVIKIGLGLLLPVDDINRLLSSADFAALTVKKKEDSIILANYAKLIEDIKKLDEFADQSCLEEFDEIMIDSGCESFFFSDKEV